MSTCYCRRCLIHDDPGGCLVAEAQLASKARLDVPAYLVVGGDLVEYVGTVASTHYCGPSGTVVGGVVTLCFTSGDERTMPAESALVVLR